MGSSVKVTLGMYEAVFDLLNKYYKGVELVKPPNNKLSKTFLRITNEASKASFIISKKDLDTYFKYIESDSLDKAISEIEKKLNFLTKQSKKVNGKKKAVPVNKKIEDIEIKPISSGKSNKDVEKLFIGAFNKGSIVWEESAGAFAFVVSEKKGKKTKENRIILSKKISSKISALTDRGVDFMQVTSKLKSNYTLIKQCMTNFFITPDCFANTQESYDSKDKLKNKVLKWNSFYWEDIFVLNDFSLYCNGIMVDKNEFLKIYSSSSDDDFIATVSKVLPNTVEKLKYIGGESLENFFEDNYEKDLDSIDNCIKILRNISVKDIEFISKNKSFFNKVYSDNLLIDKLTMYKKQIDTLEVEIIKYYKYIELRKGPFVIVYSNPDGEFERDAAIFFEINGILDNLEIICNSGSIALYKKALSKVKNTVGSIPKMVLKDISDKYPVDNDYLGELQKFIKKDLTSLININVSIKNGLLVFVEDTNIYGLNDDEIDNLISTEVDRVKKFIYDMCEKKVLDKITREEEIKEILSIPYNNLIVSCVRDIEKKGITTYAGVLSGKKNLPNDDKYLGKLKKYGYQFILSKIQYLIDIDVLYLVRRTASFGSYWSVEVRNTVKNILASISSNNSIEEISYESEEFNLSLTDFIDKSNNLKDINKYFKLKSISVDDIEFLVKTFSNGGTINKKVILDVANILKDCEELSKETVFFIRLQVNLVKTPSLKSFLSEILIQEQLKSEGDK